MGTLYGHFIPSPYIVTLYHGTLLWLLYSDLHSNLYGRTMARTLEATRMMSTWASRAYSHFISLHFISWHFILWALYMGTLYGHFIEHVSISISALYMGTLCSNLYGRTIARSLEYYGDFIWWLCMVTLYSHFIWLLYMVTLHGGFIWWLYMVTLYCHFILTLYSNLYWASNYAHIESDSFREHVSITPRSACWIHEWKYKQTNKQTDKQIDKQTNKQNS